MKLTLAAMLFLLPASAFAAEPLPLRVTVQGMKHGAEMPPEYALCVADAQAHTKPGANVSPLIGWSAGPEKTKSYAVIMHDADVPVARDNANKEGHTLPADAARRTLYHWVLADIPPQLTSLARAQESARGGALANRAAYGARGTNELSHHGYDGPCPPWNDERVHQYHFTVYALDVASLEMKGDFTAAEALERMKGHVLARGEIMGTYSQNPGIATKH